MGNFPAANPVEDDFYIIGGLYHIKNENDFSWAIGQLDDYEGVNAESEEERHYRRAITDVYCNDMILLAWIYWYHGDTSGRPVIESGDMLQYLQDKQ